jgi:hypothetical protein
MAAALVSVAVVGFVYFAVWSFADWLSCLCSRFDGDGRKQDVRMRNAIVAAKDAKDTKKGMMK